MTPTIIVIVLFLYFSALLLIARYTSYRADTQTFFTGNRSSPWYLVAFGMIGTSLSGVTFISVPGNVATDAFSYFQVVLGYLVGYFFIAFVLMPMYYRLNLVSIYTYLEHRFGFWSYKTGSFFFLLSRTIGASFRLYLAAEVLQIGLFDAWGVPFVVTVSITIALIWVYTHKGGIKTIVWTDTFQTIFLIGSLVVSVYWIIQQLGLGARELYFIIFENPKTQIFFFDIATNSFFVKQFISGAFIAIVMTGLDQDLMQKNLTCKNIEEAQWNMITFSIILVIVNFLFLTLGALLYQYAYTNQISIPSRTDQLFPLLALNHFGLFAGIMFLLGITASSYASADSALAALTTAFCIDFLGFSRIEDEVKKRKIKFLVHLAFSALLLIIIVLFRWIQDEAVIVMVFKIAGYTYGPLLGMFFFGLFTKLSVNDYKVPFIAMLSPVVTFFLNRYSKDLFWGYSFGFELLIVNGALTFFGLLIFATKSSEKHTLL